MKTFVIEQKMSGTGSIHDIASEHFDREIKFRGQTKYAVVYASYYGNGSLYKTFSSEEQCAKFAEKESKAGYSLAIIDSDGNRYSYYRDYYSFRLVRE